MRKGGAEEGGRRLCTRQSAVSRWGLQNSYTGTRLRLLVWKCTHLISTDSCEGKRVKTENAAEIARRQGLNLFTAFVLAFLHIGAVAALFMFSWKALAVSAVLYYIAIGLGI